MLSMADKLRDVGLVTSDEAERAKTLKREIDAAEFNLQRMEKAKPPPQRTKDDNKRIAALKAKLDSLRAERITTER